MSVKYSKSSSVIYLLFNSGTGVFAAIKLVTSDAKLDHHKAERTCIKNIRMENFEDNLWPYP